MRADIARLYTYLPKQNTADTDGLLSTANVTPEKGNSGWRKYIDRVRNYPQFGDPEKRENVLKWLDATIPGLVRSKSISMLSEPIGRAASKDLKQFAKTHALYSVDPAQLLAAGIVTQLYKSHVDGVSGFKIDKVDPNEKLDWAASKKNSRFLFSRIPHYFVETANGSIPAAYVRKES